jgi:hypothetical protein
MDLLLTAIGSTAGIKGLLIGFLILVIVLAIIGGLVWCIENWVHPLPPPVKLVLAIILVILIIIWGINAIGWGG